MVAMLTAARALVIAIDRVRMKNVITVLTGFALSSKTWADKYGIDEAMGESDASLGDMFFGALIIAAIYWAWKKFLG